MCKLLQLLIFLLDMKNLKKLFIWIQKNCRCKYFAFPILKDEELLEMMKTVEEYLDHDNDADLLKFQEEFKSFYKQVVDIGNH